jgi:hypothetical protein
MEPSQHDALLRPITKTINRSLYYKERFRGALLGIGKN